MRTGRLLPLLLAALLAAGCARHSATLQYAAMPPAPGYAAPGYPAPNYAAGYAQTDAANDPAPNPAVAYPAPAAAAMAAAAAPPQPQRSPPRLPAWHRAAARPPRQCPQPMRRPLTPMPRSNRASPPAIGSMPATACASPSSARTA